MNTAAAGTGAGSPAEKGVLRLARALPFLEEFVDPCWPLDGLVVATARRDVTCYYGTAWPFMAPAVLKLPGQDSNLDKESQNLLCYRYTTG